VPADTPRPEELRNEVAVRRQAGMPGRRARSHILPADVVESASLISTKFAANRRRSRHRSRPARHGLMPPLPRDVRKFREHGIAGPDVVVRCG